MFSLKSHFQKQAERYNYTIDDIQCEAIEKLTQLSTLLCSNKALNPPCYYLWGPVGRGKSWLLNTFFEGVPITAKKRFHFHSFLKQLHQKNFEYSAFPDATNKALHSLIFPCKLICFDEFHVHDIGDAMLIVRLFKILFEYKIAIITTSNYNPDSLLPNPLYHERFLPAIELIKKHMTIINITGEIDYRSLPQTNKHGFTAGYYISPATLEQREKHSLNQYHEHSLAIQVTNRTLNSIGYTGDRILFNFQEICEKNTSISDYLILVEQFNTWIIDNVPLLSTTSIGAQQRFINLIDILYDQNKCLYLLSPYSLQEILANTAIDDMIRTHSRLTQLQKC